MSALTQLSSIKGRLGIETFDMRDDGLLNNAIAGLSQRIGRECNRALERAAGAVFDFRADEMALRVDRYPVEAVTSFALKTTEAEGWVVLSPMPDYFISPARSVIELAGPLGSQRQSGRVVFDGGYVLPGTVPDAGQTALPDDLEQAVVEQVSYWYQRRNQLGLVTVRGDRESVQQFKTLDLLPGVQAVMRGYERMML